MKEPIDLDDETDERPRKRRRYRDDDEPRKRHWWMNGRQVLWSIAAIYCLLFVFCMFGTSGVYTHITLACFSLTGYLLASCLSEWDKAKK